MKTKTIVVFGCTGTVGASVLEQLSRENCQVRGILRDPQRAYPIDIKPRESSNISYLASNLASEDDLKKACLRADALFLLTATSPKQIVYETNIINAAKSTGVKRIIKLSAPNIAQEGIVEVSHWHREIENVLEQSGIEFCCLRPYAFMQNWERNTFTIQRFGKLYGSLDHATRNFVDCRDVAAVAVKFLLTDEELKHKFITLTRPEAISNYDMAERISKAINSKVEYINVSAKQLYDDLVKRAKLPDWLANRIVELDNLAKAIPEPTDDSIESILGRKPRIMNAYLQESKHLFARKPLWQFWS
jgi:uncharacterized protein YbjT (DUF2867 family)